MLTTVLLLAVLAIVLVLLVHHLVGSTRTQTRLDEFTRQLGGQNELGEARIEKMEAGLRSLEKELREDVDKVRERYEVRT